MGCAAPRYGRRRGAARASSAETADGRRRRLGLVRHRDPSPHCPRSFAPHTNASPSAVEHTCASPRHVRHPRVHERETRPGTSPPPRRFRGTPPPRSRAELPAVVRAERYTRPTAVSTAGARPRRPRRRRRTSSAATAPSRARRGASSLSSASSRRIPSRASRAAPPSPAATPWAARRAGGLFVWDEPRVRAPQRAEQTLLELENARTTAVIEVPMTGVRVRVLVGVGVGVGVAVPLLVAHAPAKRDPGSRPGELQPRSRPRRTPGRSRAHSVCRLRKTRLPRAGRPDRPRASERSSSGTRRRPRPGPCPGLPFAPSPSVSTRPSAVSARCGSRRRRAPPSSRPRDQCMTRGSGNRRFSPPDSPCTRHPRVWPAAARALGDQHGVRRRRRRPAPRGAPGLAEPAEAVPGHVVRGPASAAAGQVVRAVSQSRKRRGDRAVSESLNRAAARGQRGCRCVSRCAANPLDQTRGVQQNGAVRVADDLRRARPRGCRARREGCGRAGGGARARDRRRWRRRRRLRASIRKASVGTDAVAELFVAVARLVFPGSVVAVRVALTPDRSGGRPRRGTPSGSPAPGPKTADKIPPTLLRPRASSSSSSSSTVRGFRLRSSPYGNRLCFSVSVISVSASSRSGSSPASGSPVQVHGVPSSELGFAHALVHALLHHVLLRRAE